jgi:hypothetical protein
MRDEEWNQFLNVPVMLNIVKHLLSEAQVYRSSARCSEKILHFIQNDECANSGVKSKE